jgi:hypothetical protein
LSGGKATFATSSLPLGVHTITAVYAGNSAFVTSTSSGLTQTVKGATTTTIVAASPNPSKPGQPVSFTATVAVIAPATGTPTGTVTFKQGARTLGTGRLFNKKVKFSTSALNIGTHNVTAIYAGTATLAGSDGNRSFAVDPKVGPEFRVNTATANSQQLPAVARLADDGFVVAWASNLQDGSDYGIYGQRYSNTGLKAGVEFRVNTTVGAQSSPFAAGLDDGGFVVAWQSKPQDGSALGIYAQRYANNGVKAGTEFRVNTTKAMDQSQPSVAGLRGGGFVVAWTSQDQAGPLSGIYARRYDAAGKAAGSDFRVNTMMPLNQSDPSVAALTGGGFVVTWQSDGQDGSLRGIYAQRYNNGGVKAGSEFRVNTRTVGAQSSPFAAGLDDGGFAVAWQSNAQDGSGLGIYAQRYANNGGKAGAEFLVNTRTAMDQSQPSVAAFLDGGIAVAWTSSGQDGSGLGVYGQVYGFDGNPANIEFRVNTTTTNSQSQPSVAAFLDGSFVVVWTSRNQDGSLDGVYGQRFLFMGLPVQGPFDQRSEPAPKEP